MELYIQQVGTRLRIKNGIFELQNKEGAHKISPEKIDRIVLNKGISLSSDVILKAVEHQIDFLVVDGLGQPQARIWSHKFGSVSTIRKQQLFFCSSTNGSAWVIDLLEARLSGQVALLNSVKKSRSSQITILEEATKFIHSFALKLQSHSLTTPLDDQGKATLRGWEGQATRKYFQCLGKILPETYRFEKRSRRPAKDEFNAVLNYLYGMLYGQVELALITAGIDPYLGLFHRDEYNRPSLVFDMIEAYRVWAEAACLQLFFRRVMNAACFEQKEEGLWLNKLGKQIVIASMNEFLDTVIQYKGRRRSRKAQLKLDAQELAQKILGEVIDKSF
ncbi:MAG: CRISPR-associated endonuclease Cas1 [Bacteroidia bacterium]|nr:CRISPR-associated endonuclease Cas1 [Bacteroidia bacterium]